MKLSKEEKELILQRRMENGLLKPTLKAFLKEDLFITYGSFTMEKFVSNSEKSNLIKNFEKSL